MQSKFPGNYSHLLFYLLVLPLLTTSCFQNNESNSNTEINIPSLIDRNKKIQFDKEWDYVQNFYMDQKKKLNNNPRDNEAKLKLAQLYIKEARVTGEHGHYYPAALQMCSEILGDSELNENLQFRSLTTKAGVQLSLHEFNSALNTAQEAIKLNDRNAQIHGVLADSYVELGDYEKAVEMADRMVGIKPDIRSYSRVSYLREIHGDIDGAIKAMTLAVESGFPGYDETAWAMLTLGDLYNTYDQPDKAQVIYEAILKERPNYPFAIAALADLKFQEGDNAEAEKMLNEATNIIPEVGFYVQLAEIYKDEKREEEFNKTMDEVMLMLEDDVASGHNMNLEYVHIYRDILNNNSKALEFALKEYKKRPENIDVNKELAAIYKLNGNEELAYIHLNKASTTKSKNPELLALQLEFN